MPGRAGRAGHLGGNLAVAGDFRTQGRCDREEMGRYLGVLEVVPQAQIIHSPGLWTI